VRVRTKLLLCTALILTAAIVLAFWWDYWAHREELMTFSRERVVALAESVERAIELAMLQERPQDVHTAVLAAARSGDIEIVAVMNPQGDVRAASPPDLVGRRLLPEAMQSYLVRIPYVFPDRTAAGEDVEAVIRPLLNRPSCYRCHDRKQAQNGYLYVAVSPRRINAILSSTLRQDLIAAAITVLVGVIALALLSDLIIARPISSLLGAMRAVEAGEARARVLVRGHDEFAQLAERFNAMVFQVEAARKEVDRAHQAEISRASQLATVGELAASLAHEIKNPLAGIKGAVQVLLDQAGPGHPHREIFEAILQQADRLGHTLRELLDFARPVPPQFGWGAVNDVVDRVSGLVGQDPAGARIVIEKDLAEDLPRVRLDEAQMSEVLLNIMLNAVQMMPDGGRVTVRTRRDGPDHVLVEVEDSGPGIPAHVLPQIFKPFFTTKHKGSGLGLAICARIVRDHGGTIAAGNGDGRGARFMVRLPIAGPEGPADEGKQGPVATEAHRIGGGR
jgi:signal transduction histidine kinase